MYRKIQTQSEITVRDLTTRTVGIYRGVFQQWVCSGCDQGVRGVCPRCVKDALGLRSGCARDVSEMRSVCARGALLRVCSVCVADAPLGARPKLAAARGV